MKNARCNLFFGIIFGMSTALMTTESQGQTLIGDFGDWTAFTDGSGKNKVCYIASEPKKETGNYKRRGNVYVLVTHRPAEKIRDVFELRAGYIFKKSSEVIVKIDGQVYKLFTDRGTAWARNATMDRSISRMMIRGKSMIIIGYSARNTKTTDKYSLRGFTAAYKAISKACGIK
jgi:invasion protein IalB